MSWTLMLVFLVASQEPSYVTVEAADSKSCADMGDRLQFAMGDNACQQLRWACVGPNDETIGDQCPNPEGATDDLHK